MTVTAYVQGSTHPTTLGNLKDGGTLTVDGVTVTIPDKTQVGGRLAPHRIREALETLGYRMVPDYREQMSDPGTDGVFTVPVVKL